MQPLKINDWFDARSDFRSAFLARTGWDDAVPVPVGEDCAFRRYFRLRRNGGSVILMETVPEGSAIATPGHALSDFVRIGSYLRAAGLHTPAVLEADEAGGYLLLEDLGDTSFKKALAQGDDADEIYSLAADVLACLRDKIRAEGIALPHYRDSHVHKGLRRIVDWYMPAQRGRKNEPGLADDYLAAWAEVEKRLPPCPEGFLHIDFHVENLMWLPAEHGLARAGILDFQGAMYGPQPYDLANLLEDARIDVPADLRRRVLSRYVAGLAPEGQETLRVWYRVMATQFHCRVAGQFIRLAVRDGKPRYLQHLPRLAAYLRHGLEDPVLEPVRCWFAQAGVDFTAAPAVDPARVAPLIAADAF